MAWIQVTDADVMAAATKERQSVAAIKGRDDLADIVSEVIEDFRSAISAFGYALGPDGTIPSGFKSQAVNLSLWQFLLAVPRNDAIHSKERESAADNARSFLEALRAGKVAVELPPGVTAAAPRTGNWNSENKLIGRTHPVPTPSTQFQSTDSTVQPYANPGAPPDT